MPQIFLVSIIRQNDCFRNKNPDFENGTKKAKAPDFNGIGSFFKLDNDGRNTFGNHGNTACMAQQFFGNFKSLLQI